MTLFEILNFNRELVDRLISVGFRLEDCRFVDLYRDYRTMKMEGVKKTWLVAFLAEKYGVSERKVYGVIRHLETDCTVDAA